MITGRPFPGGEQRVQGVIVRARRRSGGHNEPFGGVQHLRRMARQERAIQRMAARRRIAGKKNADATHAHRVASMTPDFL
jgi:hypothetical protein